MTDRLGEQFYLRLKAMSGVLGRRLTPISLSVAALGLALVLIGPVRVLVSSRDVGDAVLQPDQTIMTLSTLPAVSDSGITTEGEWLNRALVKQLKVLRIYGMNSHRKNHLNIYLWMMISIRFIMQI